MRGRKYFDVRSIVAIAGVFLSACSGSALHGSDGATRATKDGSYTYQPDVVRIGGGDDAIRGATDDGLTWTIAGSAIGVGKLKVGSVMYASAQAVGRVVDLQKVGDDVAVTLAPVQLTEVFRDAHFVIDTPIDPADVKYQEVPGLPGALSVPDDVVAPTQITSDSAGPSTTSGSPASTRRFSAGGVKPQAALDSGPPETIVTPPLRLSALRKAKGGRLPPQRSSSVGVTVGDWEVEPAFSPNTLTLKVGHKINDSLKVFIDVTFKVENLRIRADTTIANGRLVGGGRFTIEGIKSVAVDVSAGSATGASANTQVRVEVPVDLTWPIPGEPLVYSNKWKFSVATAFGGNNSTLTASGEWKLDGPIGVIDGALTGPVLTTTKSILDSVAGLAIGPSGIVFAVETKMQFGIGIPVAFAGPYAKVVLSLGLTNGSALGAPFARCVGGTLDGWVGGGAGLSLSSAAFDELKKLLPKEVKIDFEQELLKNFKHVSQTVPDVPVCRA